MEQKEKFEALKEFMEKNDISPSDLQEMLRRKSEQDRHNAIKETMEGHKSLVGKCFRYTKQTDRGLPPKNLYIKVISHRASNEWYVTCLVFDEHPSYLFEYQSSKIGNPGDYYLGRYDFTSIRTYEFMTNDVRLTNEISSEEYNAALTRYVDELEHLEWSADRDR